MQFANASATELLSHHKKVNMDRVQIDSLVVLKIIRHYEIERSAAVSDVAQGYLTGMVNTDDRCLEVTNCFPMPKVQADEDEEVLGTYQTEILRKFRQVNIDYQLVGFYQSIAYGSCFNDTFIESMFDYQSSVEDSIVIVHDPVKTVQGTLSVRAYRLSDSALKLCYKDFSPESVKRMGLTFETLFEELPIVLRNSHLVNIMLCEVALKQSMPSKQPLLDLGTGGSLEKSLRNLMSHVDSLNGEMNRYGKYVSHKQKQDAARDTLLQKRMLENESRRARGEAPLPEEDVSKLFKMIQPPTMLDGMLHASQIMANLDHTIKVAAQNLGKVFLTEALVEEKKDQRLSQSSGTQ